MKLKNMNVYVEDLLKNMSDQMQATNVSLSLISAPDSNCTRGSDFYYSHQIGLSLMHPACQYVFGIESMNSAVN